MFRHTEQAIVDIVHSLLEPGAGAVKRRGTAAQHWQFVNYVFPISQRGLRRGSEGRKSDSGSKSTGSTSEHEKKNPDH